MGNSFTDPYVGIGTSMKKAEQVEICKTLKKYEFCFHYRAKKHLCLGFAVGFSKKYSLKV